MALLRACPSNFGPIRSTRRFSPLLGPTSFPGVWCGQHLAADKLANVSAKRASGQSFWFRPTCSIGISEEAKCNKFRLPVRTQRSLPMEISMSLSAECPTNSTKSVTKAVLGYSNEVWPLGFQRGLPNFQTHNRLQGFARWIVAPKVMRPWGEIRFSRSGIALGVCLGDVFQRRKAIPAAWGRVAWG